MAHRLVAMGIGKDDRVALVAETGPEFAALFCACVYAGAWPVPLPLPTSFGGKESYIDQLAVQLQSSRSQDAALPGRNRRDGSRGGRAAGLRRHGLDDFRRQREAPEGDLPEASPDDICYLQYSSGSTRFPHGVAVTHKALLHNLCGHADSMDIGENDRVVSWLPWYHDMGLVGCFLSLIANQVSVDYLQDRAFRPPPAGLARPDQPQPGQHAQLFADLRLRHLRAAHFQPEPMSPNGSTCRAGALPATART